jgi:hypothetical protein
MTNESAIEKTDQGDERPAAVEVRLLALPCDHCDRRVRIEVPGEWADASLRGETRLLVCEKCRVEMAGNPHSSECVKCDASFDDQLWPRVHRDCVVPAFGGRFGLCPICHDSDGYISVSWRWDHCMLCKEHKVRWFFHQDEADFLHDWPYEQWGDDTPDQIAVELLRIFHELGFDSFAVVRPFYPPDIEVPGLSDGDAAGQP